MSKEPTSIPYRPLPKIMARGPRFPPTSAIQIGTVVRLMRARDRVWRLYEITAIDGDISRIVTPDKRYAMNIETGLLQKMKDLGMLSRVETE